MKTVLLLTLLFFLAAPVQAAGPEPEVCGDCPQFESGREFGDHVSFHAQPGHIGEDMNPGHHHGFSPWAQP